MKEDHEHEHEHDNEHDKNHSLVDFLAGDQRERLKSVHLTSRLEKYASMHQRADEMSEYLQSLSLEGKKEVPHQLALARSLHNCGDWLHFRDYYTIDETRLHRANFCKKHLLCPLCAARRGSKATMAYMKRFSVLLQQDPDLKAYLVTLTTSNGPDLQERYEHLRSSLRRQTEMRKQALHGLRSPIEMNKALGGVGSIEVKKGSGSGTWHIHQHSIWLCHERPYETRLSENWLYITGDSYIVDVKKIDHENPLTGFLEVFAYAVKASCMNLPDTLEAFKVLSSKRLINSFGIFRGVEIPEDLTDGTPDEDLPFVDLFYQYFKGSGYSNVQAIKHKTRDKR